MNYLTVNDTLYIIFKTCLMKVEILNEGRKKWLVKKDYYEAIFLFFTIDYNHLHIS